jgi:hypothetical protein
VASTDVINETNRLIAYHSAITRSMTRERTALESALIPVTAYILVSAIECWCRHPEIIATIDAAMPAEEIALAGHRPGIQINPVYLWSTANIFLTGRKMLTLLSLAPDDAEAVHVVLDFWQRAALAYRGDGYRQAWDAGFVARPYGPAVIDELLSGMVGVADAGERARIKRFNATLVAYLFLLYFDTRVGTGDTGPYPLPDGRVLLVRDYYRLGQSDFWWSEVAKDVPYHHLTAALVLDGVDVKVNDWGTSITDPEDYLDHVSGFALFTTDTPDRSLRAVPLDQLDAIVAEVRQAQAQHYRNVAAMSRDEKIRCGAYVYFTFPRPFAEVAGVADRIDWEVPRESTARGWYEMFREVEATGPPPEPDEIYYWPIDQGNVPPVAPTSPGQG